MRIFAQIAVLLCLAVPTWGQVIYGNSCGPQGSDVCLLGDYAHIQFQEPGIPRAEVQELTRAYQEVILTLEAQLREHDSIIRSLQAQLAANRDYQKALEENNKVLRELVGQGKKKSKLDWVWFGVKTGGTIFTACELTSVC